MKLEDIQYTFPSEQITEENFDKEKWIKENPIDYFKFIYDLLITTEELPQNIKKSLVVYIHYYIIRLYIPDTLYKFYSLNNKRKLNKQKFKTLQNKQIFMSKIKDFNDPFDGKAFFYDSSQLADINRLEVVNGKIIDDFTAFYRGTALTENDTSCMPMWAHYSNNHQGFCVAYDMKNPENTKLAGCTFPVQYTNERLDITDYMKNYVKMVLSEIDKQTKIGKTQIRIDDTSLMHMLLYLCNVKHSTWSYEKEFRCTMGSLEKCLPYIDATPKAIYIGMNCNKQNRNKLVEIAKIHSIPVYQMRLDELSENFCLKESLLEN